MYSFIPVPQSAYTPVLRMIGVHLSTSDLSSVRSDSGVAFAVLPREARRYW